MQRRKNKAQRQQASQKPAKAAQKKVNMGDKLLKAEGGQGTNPLASANQVITPNGDSLTVPGVDPTLDVVVKVTDRSLYYLSMGICLRAVKRGWSTQQNYGDGAIFYAFRYLYDTFVSATQGTVPLLQQAPWWFWELIHAMRPKTERFKTGKIGYTTSIELTGQATDDVFNLSNAEQYVLFWGIPNTAIYVNGYPVLVPPQQPYTEEAGAKAVQSLFAFYNANGMSKRTGDPGDQAWMTHDTSFFATVYPDLGQSFFSPGGFSTQIACERPITAPIFAKFATWEGEGDESVVWKGSYQFRRSAGSPCYVGPRLSELNTPKELYNKGEVLFKLYNFDKFVERLALTCAVALESEASRPNLAGAPIVSCPLTFQDFQIMLRQAILPYFCNDMAQDLRMSADSGAKNVVTMLPLVVGPNGVSLTAQSESPLFPKFFAETVRAVSRITFVPKGKFGKQGEHGKVIDVVPILCRPFGESLPTNYTFDAGNGNTQGVFNSLAQLPIQIIDASAQDGQTQYYLDLNGQTLQSNIAEWNTWIKQRITLTGLTTLGSEHGINALNANVYTTHERLVQIIPQLTANTSSVTKKKPAAKGPKVIGSAPKRYGATQVAPEGEDYLKGVAPIQVSSQIPFTSAIWKYAQHMTLPSFFVYAPTGSGSSVLYQTNMVEPYTLPLAGLTPDRTIDQFELDTYSNSYTHSLNSASLDIRPPLGDGKSEMEVDLDTLAAMGRGGLFTDIAAALSDSFGASGVSKVLRTVGQATGF